MNSQLRFFNHFKFGSQLIILFAAVLIVVITNTSVTTVFHRGTLLYPPQFISQNTLGYTNLIADILWLRVIQDYDYCENENIAKGVNPGMTLEDIISKKIVNSRCSRGWVYQMLDAITDIDPRFEHVYYTGAVTLSVAVDDREGARLFFEKGLLRFPKKWNLAYAAAYHYLFEVQDAARAADLLLQASQYGGPSWLPVLASRLYSQAGRYQLGVSVLEEYLKSNPEGEGAKRAKERLEKLKAEAQ